MKWKLIIKTMVLNILFLSLIWTGVLGKVKGISVNESGYFVIGIQGSFSSEVWLRFYNSDGILTNKIQIPYVRGATICVVAESNYVIIPCLGGTSFIYDLNGNFIEENNQAEISYYKFPKYDSNLIYEEPLSKSLTDLKYQYKSDKLIIQYGYNRYGEEEIWFCSNGKIKELTIDKKIYRIELVFGKIFSIIGFNGFIIILRQLRQTNKKCTDNT